MSKTMLALVLLAGVFNVQAAVYKWVDEDGNVHFSDAPKHPDAEKIHVPPPSTYTPPPPPKFEAQRPVPELNQGYSQMRITSPENEATVWDDNGNVSMAIELEPGLKVEYGHKIVYSLDGSVVAESQSTGFQFANIDRGTHRLSVAVQNATGQRLLTDSVTVHVRRRSLLDQTSPSPGPLPSVPRATSAPKAPQAPRR